MKIGIDLGGSHIGIGLVDEEGNILHQQDVDIFYETTSKEQILNYIENTILAYKQDYSIESIGIVGPGNPNGKIMTHLVNLGIEELDFNFLEDQYHIPVKVANDAKAAGLAEMKFGAMKQAEDAVFLCLGTGIGGAVFYQKKLLKPIRNTGFEIGHMIIQKDGLICQCGKRGCFETYCSMKRWKIQIEEELQKLGCEPVTGASKLLEQVKKYQSEPGIQALIQRYLDDLIIGLSNLIDIFEPEIICLGGSFVYFQDIFYAKLVNQMKERRYVFNQKDIPNIVLATLKNNAGIIGATLL